MGRSLTGTVIITGGNGLLGSEIATAIAKRQPFAHLLLAARDTKGKDVHDLIARIQLIGPRSVEVLYLDLTDLRSVTSFAHSTIDRVRNNEIPPVIDLIHSAAIASYTYDELTRDGYDPVYQTNCLAPFFLTVGLLEAFRAGDGTSDDGVARVINIRCAAISYGKLDYFDGHRGRDGHHPPPGTLMSAKEAHVRYSSSKLLASAALYALRRSLANTGNIALDIFTLDPGGMAGESNLRTGAPLSVRVAHQTRSGLRPFLRMISRTSINKVSVPAKVIAKVAFQRSVVGQGHRERYYILDTAEYEVSSVISVLRDESRMGRLLVQMMRQMDVDGISKEFLTSTSPGPTLY